MKYTQFIIRLMLVPLWLTSIACLVPTVLEVTLTPLSTPLSNETQLPAPSPTISRTAIPTVTPPPIPPTEQAILQIPLTWPLNAPDAEISAMAWYNEALVLVPQFPDRYSSREDQGSLYYLKKADILAYLDGARKKPLNPQRLPLIAPGLAQKFGKDYEGFEALAFAGDRVFLTIETSNGNPMMGYLIMGEIAPDLSRIQLDPTSLVPLPPQTPIYNKSDEALVLIGEQLLTIFEANGMNVNPNPVAHQFNLGDLSMREIPYPGIEYRITDATPTDESGKFWVINTFWPGDILLFPGPDPIAARFGKGPTHAKYFTVERLLEMQYQEDRVTLTDTAPIQLQLINDSQSRNWEGLARLDGRGFLLVTDELPETIFAFVALP